MSSRAEAVLAALGLRVARVNHGRAWLLCPWHQSPEDPPAWATAFFVRLRGRRRNAEGKLYDAAGQSHCFSCGKGGSLVELVMKVRGVGEEAAEAFVRRRGGAEEDLPRARVVVVERPPRLGRDRYRLPREVVLGPLRDWVSGAQRYARGRCGITDEEADVFGLGYAADGKLAGRVVLPWRGAGGRPGGYSARAAFPDDLEPKYLTPSVADGADLSVMFGEHLWPPPRDRCAVVVTEGALNALVSRRARPDLPVAALGGSEPGDGQAVKLATFPLVLLLVDPDAAGDKAARILRGKLSRWTRLLRAELPPGRDPLDLGPGPVRGVLGSLLEKTRAISEE